MAIGREVEAGGTVAVKFCSQAVDDKKNFFSETEEFHGACSKVPLQQDSLWDQHRVLSEKVQENNVYCVHLYSSTIKHTLGQREFVVIQSCLGHD